MAASTHPSLTDEARRKRNPNRGVGGSVLFPGNKGRQRSAGFYVEAVARRRTN